MVSPYFSVGAHPLAPSKYHALLHVLGMVVARKSKGQAENGKAGAGLWHSDVQALLSLLQYRYLPDLYIKVGPAMGWM